MQTLKCESGYKWFKILLNEKKNKNWTPLTKVFPLKSPMKAVCLMTICLERPLLYKTIQSIPHWCEWIISITLREIRLGDIYTHHGTLETNPIHSVVFSRRRNVLTLTLVGNKERLFGSCTCLWSVEVHHSWEWWAAGEGNYCWLVQKSVTWERPSFPILMCISHTDA